MAISIRLKLPFILLLAALTGCQTATQTSGTTQPSRGIFKSHIPVVPYEPEGKEQFVIEEKTYLRNKGYSFYSFCYKVDLEWHQCAIPQDKYMGLHGYFEPVEPIESGYTDLYYPVVLSNGEKFYYRAKRNAKYSSISDIIKMEEFKEKEAKTNAAAAFKPEPLVPGSKVMLNSAEFGYKNFIYKLSTGGSIDQKRLDTVRKIYKLTSSKNPEVAEMLLNMELTYDDVDNKAFISPIQKDKTYANLYIGLNDKSKWLRFKTRYYGPNWLFIDSFKVAADDYRYQSPKVEFSRDHASGDIWEWLDIAANTKELEIANKLAKSKNSVIRFQGQHYHSDKKLNDAEKKLITDTLKLYSMINK